MNERIEELIAKASSWVEVDCEFGTDSEYQLDAKKFAELIVKECINKQRELITKFQTPPPGYTHTFPEFIDGIIGGLEEGVAGIEEHFGVE